MRNLLSFALLAGLLFSCTTTPDPAIAEAEAASKAAAKAKAEENVALVTRFMEVSQTGNIDVWKEICAEDFVTYGPGIDSEVGLEEYMGMIKEMRETIDSIHSETIAILPYTVEEGEQAGDYVFWWGTNSGYFLKEGKFARIMIHTVYKIENGLIKWNTDYWDTGDLEKQLSGDKKTMVK